MLLRRLSRAAVALSAALATGLLFAGDLKPGDLKPKDERAVKDALQAHLSGESPFVLKTLSTLVARLSDEEISAVDGELARHELPRLGALLGAARFSLVVQGLERELPPLSAKEAVLVLPVIQDELAAIMERLPEEPIMAEPLVAPRELEAFEPILWNAHVVENRLATAQRLSAYLALMLKRVPRAQVANLTKEQQEILSSGDGELQKRIESAQQDLKAREAELRQARLGLSRDALTAPAISREKYLAASYWPVDAQLVTEYLNAVPKGQPAARSALAAAGAKESVAKLAQECDRLAGDLTAKSNLFFLGLHWWQRGRYGQGLDFYGLLKSPEAMHSPAAQFALIMPAEFPLPTDASALRNGEPPVPYVDRRHHYWWAWEDRSISRNSINKDNTQTIQGPREGKAYIIQLPEFV